MSDTTKQLERARRNLEKNKLREAASEYQAVLQESPSNQEAIQALADIFTRLNEPAQAAPYYAAQFDRLVETGDIPKASAIFTRFLRPFPQPPDRLSRYAALLHKQNRVSEAIEQYTAACDIYQEQKRGSEALSCLESIAALDPDNPARHVALGELAQRLNHTDLAGRCFLRAGQITLQGGPLDDALSYLGRAHSVSPGDRHIALPYAGVLLRKGHAEDAVALLQPFAAGEKDLQFLATYGDALLHAGQLDAAREVLLQYYAQKPEQLGKLFDLANAFLNAGEDDKAVSLLVQTKDWMRKARKEIELTTQIDRLAAAHSQSLALAQFVALLYEELNREARYFEALVQLFDLYVAADRIAEACDTLDRLVDIDPYDYRNHERIASIEGKADPAFLRNIYSRAAKASTVSNRSAGFGESTFGGPTVGDPSGQTEQDLDDLIVQVEIFLQYSLQAKALERLQKLAALYPGEETRNERLFALYERANWWPGGSPAKLAAKNAGAPAPPAPPPTSSAGSAPPSLAVAHVETHRDLAAIAEINRLMYRQPTPREVLSTTAAGIAQHLHATRCLIAMPGTADEGIATAEYAAPGVEPAGSARVASIIELVSSVAAAQANVVELSASSIPALRELGLHTALGIVLTDKETQSAAGALLIGDANPRQWKPSDNFFLQAVGDQLVLSVSHARLRSLVRSLSNSEEKARVLSRAAYLDSLLMESTRARKQNLPVSLIMLHVDRGNQLLRHFGDAVLDRYMEQLAAALCGAVRQSDLVIKYTAWSFVFVLANTPIETAQQIAEKLRQTAATVPPTWDGGREVTFSAVVAQSSLRQNDEVEDRVTEWINRAENGLDEVNQGAGNMLLSLATP